jgi:polyphosphate kinase 2 (PPK2 family)
VNNLDSKRFIERFLVQPGKKISIGTDFDPGYAADNLRREESDALLRQDIARLVEFQDRLYAQSTVALLVIVQAMDAVGKDSVIKHAAPVRLVQ